MKLMLTVCEWVEVPQSHAISATKNVRAEIQHVNKALFLCLCSSKQFRKYLKKTSAASIAQQSLKNGDIIQK